MDWNVDKCVVYHLTKFARRHAHKIEFTVLCISHTSTSSIISSANQQLSSGKSAERSRHRMHKLSIYTKSRTKRTNAKDPRGPISCIERINALGSHCLPGWPGTGPQAKDK